MKYDRDFEIAVQFNENTIANLKPLENPDFEEVNLASSQALSTSNGGFWGGSNITIKDCLSLFSQEEVLTGNDKWYCSKCKEHQNALKKMEIYRCPEYLILHMKRFSHQRSSFFSSKKITDEVTFPIEGLNMEPYVL